MGSKIAIIGWSYNIVKHYNKARIRIWLMIIKESRHYQHNYLKKDTSTSMFIFLV